MSLGKINKIIKFVDKYIQLNKLEKILLSDFYKIADKIIKEGKEYFSEITMDLVVDILNKKYKIKMSYESELSFDNGLNCFPEYVNLYPDIKIPPEFQHLEDQFQKLKALPQPEQRTPAWFAYRRERITASDTAAAIDENPYEPVESFIDKKCDPNHKFLDNANVYHGKKYELIATKIYEHIYNVQVFEFGALPSEKYQFLGASPDGICSCKSLDNKFSDKLGTMLEIKCVAPRGRTIETSGDIPGHICPYYYYLQVQQQLECCELEICDFWQCKLIEYKTREEFLIDDCNKTQHTIGVNGQKIEINNLIKKGMLLQFYPKEWVPEFDGDEREWKSKFIYPPRLDMTEQQYDNWVIKVMNNLHTEHIDITSTHYFHKVLYWKLEQSHNQPIKRDQKLFARILPIMQETWKKVQYYRKHLDELSELKEIVERRKKYIKTNTDFTINQDIIKNKVLFLDSPNEVKKKEYVPKNLKKMGSVDFIDDDDDKIPKCDFIDDEPVKETKDIKEKKKESKEKEAEKSKEKEAEKSKIKKKKPQKKGESDKENDNTYKKIESSIKKKTNSSIFDIDFKD
jgi:putative phage-type endonuclease